MSSSLSAHQALQLNSLAFVLFVAVAMVLFLFARRSRVQGPVLAALNICFLYFYIDGLPSFVFLAGLLGFTYAAGYVRRNWGEMLPVTGFTIVIVAMWAGLFFVKDPSFASPLNPFQYAPIHLVGISFLMFRCINYIEDAELVADNSPVTFFNYMLYFPTLIAGPIERYDSFVAHYQEPVSLTRADCLASLHRIVNGFIKKFVIADNLYPLTTFGNAGIEDLSTPMLWVYVLLQFPVLYFDFAGYCDIVIGISRLMGIPLMENFDRPFAARNIQEFWSRWHISLTSFIRDYVFTPLNRWSMTHLPQSWHFRAVVASYFLTMMLIAFWHGTTLGFLVFGLMHAAVLVALQLKKHYASSRVGKMLLFDRSMPAVLAIVLTYVFNCLTMLTWYLGPAGAFLAFSKMFGAI